MPPQYYFLAEVTDEFAPDTPEDTFENRIEAEAPPVKAELYSICDNNHWVHLFSDQDVKVECILTEQVNYLLLKVTHKFPNLRFGIGKIT